MVRTPFPRVRTVWSVPALVVLLAAGWTIAVKQPVLAQIPPRPPSSSSGAQLATYTFTSGGWATFGLALPPGAAGASVHVGNLPTQTDVKTTWSDGTIRFAVVTTRIEVPGVQAIASGAAAIGVFTPTWPRASVTFSTGGQTYVAALPAFTGADSWLSNGPLVRESRVVVTPVAGATRHPVLQVVYDVRSYSTGGHRVDITVQDVQDIPAGDAASYDVSVSIDNATVFAKSGVNQPYLTRWRKTFLTGGLIEAGVTPDFTPFYSARALPRYLDSVLNVTPAFTGNGFDILQFGTMLSDMGSPGGRPEIAPYPDWVARYVIHKRPDQRAFMLAHADLSGSWSGHITEADGVSLVSLDRFPNYWLDGRAPRRPNGPDSVRVFSAGADRIRGASAGLETAHLPSLTFVPYLVTGDRFYLDQSKLWANFTMLATWPGDPRREGGKGILAQNQTRGFAWALRTLADVAAYIPDNDPTRAYFVTRLQHNLDYLDNLAKTAPGGPFDVLRWGTDNGAVIMSTWQNAYLAWATERAGHHGFWPINPVIERIARFQARMFISEPEFPQRYASPYYPTVGRLSGTTPVFFTSMKEIFDATWGVPPGPPQPWEGYYGPETRILMMLGVPRSVPGAQEGIDYITTRTGVLADMNKRSGWALAYDPLPANAYRAPRITAARAPAPVTAAVATSGPAAPAATGSVSAKPAAPASKPTPAPTTAPTTRAPVQTKRPPVKPGTVPAGAAGTTQK
jgi:hypothetical protein